jgi:hypothetical protein
MKQFRMSAALAAASGGSAPSRWIEMTLMFAFQSRIFFA